MAPLEARRGAAAGRDADIPRGELTNAAKMIKDGLRLDQVHLGSFWDRPLASGGGAAHQELLTRERDDLLAELRDLPRNAVLRRINELSRRARKLKVHCFLVSAAARWTRRPAVSLSACEARLADRSSRTIRAEPRGGAEPAAAPRPHASPHRHYLRNQMPKLFGKEDAQRKLLADLPRHFALCCNRYGLTRGDFPDLDEFRAALVEVADLSKFPKLDKRAVTEMDKMFATDIPGLLERAVRHGK